jgi:hypothetical protein
MSEDQITNDRRATAALYAIGTYARISSPSEPVPEGLLSLDFEREPEERSGDQDRLSGLLNGLMHYARRRRLSFTDALTDAGKTYSRQRTTYLSGDAVQRARQTRRRGDEIPVIGEVMKARPGNPPVYQVDFITSREWVPEPDLTPAQPFSATGHLGEIPSAALTRYHLARTVRRIETACRNGTDPDPGDAQNLDTYLTALSGWSGLDRATVLGAFSTVLTEQDGHLLIPAPLTHPVSLAAAGMPHPPEPGAGGGNQPARAASPSRATTQHSAKGRQR